MVAACDAPCVVVALGVISVGSVSVIVGLGEPVDELPDGIACCCVSCVDVLEPCGLPCNGSSAYPDKAHVSTRVVTASAAAV